MPRHGIEKLEMRFATSGAIAANRIVKLASDDTVALADGDDANWIGVTLGTVDAAANANVGAVVRLKGGGRAEIEIAAGETITRGNLAYQAADGKIAATGTVVAGVAFIGGTAGQLAEILM